MLYVLDDAVSVVVMLNERTQHAMVCGMDDYEVSGSLCDLTKNRSWQLVEKWMLPLVVRQPEVELIFGHVCFGTKKEHEMSQTLGEAERQQERTSRVERPFSDLAA